MPTPSYTIFRNGVCEIFGPHIAGRDFDVAWRFFGTFSLRLRRLSDDG